MTYIYASVLLFVNSAALALIPFGLPGIWLMSFATAALAWWRWEEGMIGAPVLLGMLALAILAEILEFAASAAGARKAGGTRKGVWGGLLGGFLGAIFAAPFIPVPIVGTVLGASLGAMAGATLLEYVGGRPLTPALRSGTGAAAGRFVGTVVKLGVGAAAWVLAAVAALWPS